MLHGDGHGTAVLAPVARDSRRAAARLRARCGGRRHLGTHAPHRRRTCSSGGPTIYGLLFGFFGVGAVCGALLSAAARQKLQNEKLVRLATIGFAITAGVAAFSPWLVLTLRAFVIGGASWVLMLSTFNITVQLSSPRWVSRALARDLSDAGVRRHGDRQLDVGRGRGEPSAWSCALAASSVMLALSTLLGFLRAPSRRPDKLNLAAARGELNVTPKVELGPESGRVITTVTYQVAPRDHAGVRAKRCRRFAASAAATARAAGC